MVDNQFDVGMQQDFDNMTEDLSLGKEVTVYPREDSLTYEGQESTSSGLGTGVTETVFMQEVDRTNEAVRAGVLNVGDVKFTFKAGTTAEVEGYVESNSRNYKIIGLTIVQGQSNNEIAYVLGYGKRVANR